MTNVILGGGPDVKMSHFYKLRLKSISSHSESFWGQKIGCKMGVYPNTWPFFSNFSNLKILKVLHFVGTFSFLIVVVQNLLKKYLKNKSLKVFLLFWGSTKFLLYFSLH